MSKILIRFTFTALIFLGLNIKTFGQGYDIKITVEGMQDSVAYLGYVFGDQRFLTDTTRASAPGVYRFTGAKELPTGIYFLYTPNYFLELIVKEQKFSLKTTKEGAFRTMEVTSSPENLVFKEFQMGMVELQTQKQAIRKKLEQASTAADSSAIFEEDKQVNEKLNDFRQNLIAKYPDSFVAKFVRLMALPDVPGIPEYSDVTDDLERGRLKYEYYKRKYFESIDFDDSGLLRTPVLKSPVIHFLDKVVIQHPDTINVYVDKIMTKVLDQPDAFRFWLVTLFKKYQESKIMGMDGVMVNLAEKYYLTDKADWLSKEDKEKLAEEVEFVSPNLVGKQAPTLQLLDTLLSPINLSQVKAEFTILFFYDPNCGHCKKSTPVLLEEYHRLKDSGVEVMGICISTDIEEWRRFVYEYELDWINAADPYYRSNMRRDYNVRTTPQVYILDKNKKIIAKKLEVEQLAGFIEQYRAVQRPAGED